MNVHFSGNYTLMHNGKPYKRTSQIHEIVSGLNTLLTHHLRGGDEYYIGGTVVGWNEVRNAQGQTAEYRLFTGKDHQQTDAIDELLKQPGTPLDIKTLLTGSFLEQFMRDYREAEAVKRS